MAGEKVWALSKEEAKYRPAQNDKVRCDVCKYMLPRANFGTCKLVRGVIRGQDTCHEFRPLPKRS